MGVMTWGELRLQLQQSAPGISLDLVDEFLNTRYARVLDHKQWSWLEAVAYIETTAPYQSSTDTVTVTQGSANVVGTGTSWTSDLNGQKFQVVSDGPFYTFTVIDATHATLDRVYESSSASGVGYRLFRNAYALPADFKSVMDEESADDGFDLTRMDELGLGASVGFRDQIGTPAVYAITPSPVSLDGGTSWQIEMFPIPAYAKGYPLHYQRAAPAFDGTTTAAAPLPFVTDAVLLAGARADIFAHLGDFNKAKYNEGKFADELSAMVRADALKAPKPVIAMAPRFTRHRLRRLLRNSFPRIPN
jgi:hypothetical protein